MVLVVGGVALVVTGSRGVTVVALVAGRKVVEELGDPKLKKSVENTRHFEMHDMRYVNTY